MQILGAAADHAGAQLAHQFRHDHAVAGHALRQFLAVGAEILGSGGNRQHADLVDKAAGGAGLGQRHLELDHRFYIGLCRKQFGDFIVASKRREQVASFQGIGHRAS